MDEFGELDIVMGVLLIPVIALLVILIIVFLINFLRRYSRPERLRKIADEMSWKYLETYVFPSDIQTILQRDSRLFSREFYNITPVDNALVGEINGLDTIIFDCPVKLMDKFVAKASGYSEKAFVSGKYGRLSNPVTVLLLKTTKTKPRFFIGERTWADNFCDPIFMTDTYSILGDDLDALRPLMQTNVQNHYADIGDLSIEGNGNFALFYYLTGSRLKRGYLKARKDYVFDLVAEVEFLIKTLDLGKSFEEKLNFDQTK